MEEHLIKFNTHLFFSLAGFLMFFILVESSSSALSTAQ